MRNRPGPGIFGPFQATIRMHLHGSQFRRSNPRWHTIDQRGDSFASRPGMASFKQSHEHVTRPGMRFKGSAVGSIGHVQANVGHTLGGLALGDVAGGENAQSAHGNGGFGEKEAAFLDGFRNGGAEERAGLGMLERAGGLAELMKDGETGSASEKGEDGSS